MKLSEFDYDLPEELIALEPMAPRDHSRLLVVDRATKTLAHHHFYDLPELLNPNDLVILNNTRVFPARLFAQNATGKTFEVFLLERKETDPPTWKCLARPGKKIKGTVVLHFPDGMQAEIFRSEADTFTVTFPKLNRETFFPWLETQGKMPLPPYIKRDAGAKDATSYQTVFAKHLGSVAAPTAGLHFTPDVFQALTNKGVGTAEITLHVGYGTFSPIQTENIHDHVMHSEEYEIPGVIPKLIKETHSKGGKVIAVGTTTLRSLESMPTMGLQNKTSIYITPGYKLQTVDSLITNFHIPKSSLYVLVSALLGVDLARHVYNEAIQNRYRFYSYGDAMLIL